MKLLFIAVFLFITLCDISTSTHIECKYRTYDYIKLGNVYYCEIDVNPHIWKLEDAEITSINGTHMDSKTDDDVVLFQAYDKVVKHFPRGVEKFFKNIKALYITDCELREIRQSDLKPFPKLEFINFKWNDIKVLEKGLFDFNPQLKTIILYERNLIHIDPNVFDNLPNLDHLWLDKVPCARAISDNRAEVEEVIKVVKQQCVDPSNKNN